MQAPCGLTTTTLLASDCYLHFTLLLSYDGSVLLLKHYPTEQELGPAVNTRQSLDLRSSSTSDSSFLLMHTQGEQVVAQTTGSLLAHEEP